MRIEADAWHMPLGTANGVLHLTDDAAGTDTVVAFG